MREATGKRGSAEEGSFRSRRGFGFQARARPGNTAIRDLLVDVRYTEAALAFPAGTRAGEIKGGAV